MNDTATHATAPKGKRAKPKPQGTGQLIQKVSEAATDLAKSAELAVQRLRQDGHRNDKKKDAVMAILQQRVDIRGQIKRIWPLLSESDQGTLRDFGFQAPREDRS
jgi:hypothetical protein